MQAYADPRRASDPYALPDVETFKGYKVACLICDHNGELFPDYYGLVYPEHWECPECGHVGARLTSIIPRWFHWPCFPGCLPDSDPIGPFDTEEEALSDARDG